MSDFRYPTDEDPLVAEHARHRREAWKYDFYVIGAVLMTFAVSMAIYLIVKYVGKGLKRRRRRRRVGVEYRPNTEIQKDYVVIDMEGVIPETMEPSRMTQDMEVESRNPDLMIHQMYRYYMANRMLKYPEYEFQRPEYHQARKKAMKFQVRAAGLPSASTEGTTNYFNKLELIYQAMPCQRRGQLRRTASMEIHPSTSMTVLQRSYSSTNLAAEDTQELGSEQKNETKKKFERKKKQGGETGRIPVSGGEDNESLKQIPMQPMDKNESHEPDEVNILIAQVKTTNNDCSLEHSASQMPKPTSHKVKKNKHQGSTASKTCSCFPAEHVFTLPANWESLADENISTSDEEDLRTFQTGGFQYSPFPDLDLSAVSAVQFNAKPSAHQGQNVEKVSPSSVKVEIVTIEAKAEKGSEDEALEPSAKPDTQLTSVTNNGESVSSSSSDSNCTVILNPQYVHPLDDNMNEAAVDLKTADETPNPLEEKVTSNSVPADAATDSSSTEPVDATVGRSATPAAQGATDRNKKPKIRTGLQETLEGEFEDTTEAPEKATIDQQGQKIFRTDYTQAECGGVREKVGNYVLTPTHRVTTQRTDAMLGPSIFSTILEPLNDLVSSLSPDGRGPSLEEPDGSPKLNFGEVKDSDEEKRNDDMNCLPKPKNTGSCQTEGIQYLKDDAANESKVVLEHEAAVQAILRDEPPDMEIQSELFFTISSAMKKRGGEMEPDPGTQKQNEIGTSAAEEQRNTDKEPQE